MLTTSSPSKLILVMLCILQFHFCSGDASLASTSISLLPILKDDVTANTPSKIEGLFPLTPSRSSPPAQPPRQPQALLGISIVFKIEAEYNAVVGQTGMSPVLAGGGDAFRPEVGLIIVFRQVPVQYSSTILQCTHDRQRKIARMDHISVFLALCSLRV